MFRRTALALTATACLLVLAGCSAQLGDRGGQNGAPPDFIGDVQWVEVYRNVDRFPNIARVCVLGLGFATPSTGSASGEGGTNGATPLLRVPEWDTFCAVKGKS